MAVLSVQALSGERSVSDATGTASWPQVEAEKDRVFDRSSRFLNLCSDKVRSPGFDSKCRCVTKLVIRSHMA